MVCIYTRDCYCGTITSSPNDNQPFEYMYVNKYRHKLTVTNFVVQSSEFINRVCVV